MKCAEMEFVPVAGDVITGSIVVPPTVGGITNWNTLYFNGSRNTGIPFAVIYDRETIRSEKSGIISSNGLIIDIPDYNTFSDSGIFPGPIPLLALDEVLAKYPITYSDGVLLDNVPDDITTDTPFTLSDLYSLATGRTYNDFNGNYDFTFSNDGNAIVFRQLN